MDTFARALKIASKIIEDGRLDGSSAGGTRAGTAIWGARSSRASVSLEDIERHAIENNIASIPSGRQELIENILNGYL
jgi:xylose isomerase